MLGGGTIWQPTTRSVPLQDDLITVQLYFQYSKRVNYVLEQQTIKHTSDIETLFQFIIR